MIGARFEKDFESNSSFMEEFASAIHDFMYIMPVVLTGWLLITMPLSLGLIVTWVLMLVFHFALVFNNEVDNIKFTLD